MPRGENPSPARTALFTLAALLAVTLLATPTAAAGEDRPSARRPNILFLFTDDQRPDGAGALGNPLIRTPAIDALAREGLVFRNAYCLGSNSGAVCLPSRNMLMSGRTYFRWEGQYAPADRPNLPTSLKQAGYATYHHGKRGNSALRIQELFEVDKYVDDQAARLSGEPGKIIVDDAVAYLTDHPDDRPFFMYLAFANPHDPRVAAQRYLDLYERDKIPLPANYMPLHPFDNGEMIVRDELLAPWPRTPDEIRRHLHEYYAVISGLDHHIGRLLKSLKDLGLDDDTIIIFASDHGLSIGSHGLMGKQSLYDHSMKAPLIIAGPGIPKGQTDALVYLMDLFPTFCDMVGTAVPEGLDGKSLQPVIEGKAKGVRDTLFLSYRNVQRAVRDDRWKLIRYPHINKTQLFDLKEDPHELHDLAADPDQSQRIDHMLDELRRLQKDLGDTTTLTTDNPQDPTFTPPTGEALDKLLKRWKMRE